MAVTRVLVTNDDGIDAIGIRILAKTLDAAGFQVRVVAPSVDHSGAGASLGTLASREPVDKQDRIFPDMPDVEGISVDAPPAACVLLACLGAFGDFPADIVVSGINAGANTGRALIFSGTVGGALTAAQMGVPSVAVSLSETTRTGDLSAEAVGPSDFDAGHYQIAADLAVDVTRAVLAHPAPTPRTHNLNVPARDRSEIKGIIEAPPARVGSYRTVITGTDDGKVETKYQRVEAELPPESDTALLLDGWATLTVIGGPECFDGSAVLASLDTSGMNTSE